MQGELDAQGTMADTVGSTIYLELLNAAIVCRS